MKTSRIALVLFLSIPVCWSAITVVEVDPGRDISVHVAMGTKIGESLDGDIGVSSYEIHDVYQGAFDSDVITVLFYASAFRKTLPSSALLLLWRDGGNIYRPIGNDVERGILEYNGWRHALLEEGHIELIIEESKTHPPLDISDAIELAKQALVDRNVPLDEISELRISRNPWGWHASTRIEIKDINALVTMGVSVTISDTGEIIHTHLGRPRIWGRQQGDEQ